MPSSPTSGDVQVGGLPSGLCPTPPAPASLPPAPPSVPTPAPPLSLPALPLVPPLPPVPALPAVPPLPALPPVFCGASSSSLLQASGRRPMAASKDQRKIVIFFMARPSFSKRRAADAAPQSASFRGLKPRPWHRLTHAGTDACRDAYCDQHPC